MHEAPATKQAAPVAAPPAVGREAGAHEEGAQSAHPSSQAMEVMVPRAAVMIRVWMGKTVPSARSRYTRRAIRVEAAREEAANVDASGKVAAGMVIMAMGSTCGEIKAS